MNTIDFSTYKFRPSGLHNLMVKARSKSELLSETTKTYLRELWIKEVYGREKADRSNKYTSKGIMVESDSLDLVEKVFGTTFFKNQKKIENEWIAGTPDVIDVESIKDIKSSWDLWTFFAVDEEGAKKSYYFQMLGYMWLTGKTKAELLYCLVNTPDIIVNDEIYRLSFKMTEEEAEKYKVNYVFDDIEPEKRIKKFEFYFDELLLEELKQKIVAARAYMGGLSL